ncbi:uncharacterized protein ISCGN_000326, partial [Ixodes scapularis]
TLPFARRARCGRVQWVGTKSRMLLLRERLVSRRARSALDGDVAARWRLRRTYAGARRRYAGVPAARFLSSVARAPGTRAYQCWRGPTAARVLRVGARLPPGPGPGDARSAGPRGRAVGRGGEGPGHARLFMNCMCSKKRRPKDGDIYLP